MADYEQLHIAHSQICYKLQVVITDDNRCFEYQDSITQANEVEYRSVEGQTYIHVRGGWHNLQDVKLEAKYCYAWYASNANIWRCSDTGLTLHNMPFQEFLRRMNNTARRKLDF